MNDQRYEFLPLARAFRRSTHEGKILFIAAHGFAAAAIFIPYAFWVGVTGSCVCFALGFRAALRSERVLCPACHKNVLWAGLHCPICTTPIDHSQGVFGPTCSGCNTCIRITRYDHRQYRVRHCPHCTAFLSDEGL